MSSFGKDYEIHELIELAIEGNITQKQVDILEEWIWKDPSVCRYYCEYMHLPSSIQEIGLGIDPSELLGSDKECIMEFDKLCCELESQDEYSSGFRFPFKVFGVLAALVMVVILLKVAFWTSNDSVVIIANDVNAKWSEDYGFFAPDKYIYASEGTFYLEEGCVELIFNNNASVLLEAPVEFQVTSDNSIKLKQGKVFTNISNEASGFTIFTDNAIVIDIGTKIGVSADKENSTYVCVAEGKARLIVENDDNYDEFIFPGIAKRVSESKVVSDVEFKKELFVRKINSSTGMIWNGQNELSLADIVGGGSGFGDGVIDGGIDPTTGNIVTEFWGTRKAPNDYRVVGYSPYVDGVFVPNKVNKQVVSSKGNIFESCPPTSGLCFNSIMNSNRVLGISNNDVNKSNINITSAKCLIMHANSGITFDLKAIRETLPVDNIVAFKTNFGIEKGVPMPEVSKVDFWVLVDGEVKVSRAKVDDFNLYSASIEISDDNRFLTLITTEGGDPTERFIGGIRIGPIDCDWGMFADPVLIVE